MNRRAEIVLHLDQTDQLIEPCPPSPFLRRMLREEAEKFIVYAVRNHHRKPILNSLYFPQAETLAAPNISEAFHENFAFRRDEGQKQLSELRRFGLRGLLINDSCMGRFLETWRIVTLRMVPLLSKR